jgi:hypothetical protein
MHIHLSRGISENEALVGDEGLYTRITFVGRAGNEYLFYIGF